ncbi:MAG: hypothetical protein AAGF20_05940 [Pseudomonadota bacterium]
MPETEDQGGYGYLLEDDGYADLDAFLESEDLSDEEFLSSLAINHDQSGAFKPRYRRGAGGVAPPFSADDVQLEGMGGGTLPDSWPVLAEKRRRIRHYERRRRRRPNAIPIIAEGDSWTQYPLGSDFIEPMMRERDLAILCLGQAGDTVQRMLPQDLDTAEFTEAIRREQPKAFIFSGGGNDLLGVDDQGVRNITKMVEPFRQGTPYPDLLADAFVTTADYLINEFSRLVTHLKPFHQQFGLRLYTHGYGYALPGIRASHWLEDPLETMGYTTATQRKAIVRALVDAWYDRLEQFQQTFSDQVRVIRLHETAIRQHPDHWFNEIHLKHRPLSWVGWLFKEAIVADVQGQASA